MQVKEVCKRCNLTKKALEYYEVKGLVHPKVNENGYRDYSEEEIAVLKEISILRRCGIGIPEIREILESKNKAAALEKHKYIAEVRAQRLTAIRKCIDNLIQDYDIDREFNILLEHSEDVYTIKERLVLAFPGNYGLFLSLHFGRFLDGEIHTEEQKAAYAAILEYLDNVDLYLTPEFSDFLETFTTFNDKINIAELQSQVSDNMMKTISDTEAYLEDNHSEIESYLAYKVSDEFKQSPAGKIQQSMLEFQNTSGYKEVFIANMKILSKSYCEYFRQLENANQKFIGEFPTAKEIYDLS